MRLVTIIEGDPTSAEISSTITRHPSTFMRESTMNELEHTTTRVFVINPQELVRVGMRTLLNSVPDFPHRRSAPSREEALPLVLQHQPDIVIVDLRVRDGTGIETAKILSHLPATRLLFLCRHPQRHHSPLCRGNWSPPDMSCRTPARKPHARALAASPKGQAFLDPGVTRHTFAYLPQSGGS